MPKKIIMLQQSLFPTFEECFTLYLRKCEVRNMSEKTLELYKIHLSDFKRLCGQDLEYINEITSNTVDRYILNKRATNKANPITINSYLRSIRVFLYWCMKEKYIQQFTIPIPKAEKKIKETYTEAELNLLLKKPDIRKVTFNQYKLWVLSNYLLATGNRISSALNIKMKNLDFDNQIIHVEKAKNRKQQLIPMSKSLQKILQEYLLYRKGSPDDYLFCNSYGLQANQRTIQQSIADYNRSRGVTKTSAHLYRHTFAKCWILAGGDIFRLQKILNHSDLTVVKEYVNMFSYDMAVDFDKFNPLDNLNQNKERKTISMK